VIHKRVVDTSEWSNTEGRIELAIQAFKKGRFQSLQAAALTYDAPITTVRRRARGILSRRDSQPSNRKLSSTEEETLIQWILSMDQRSMPPTTASVRRSADLLVQRSESTAPQTVGQNWVRNFNSLEHNARTCPRRQSNV
jgi:hypothetical protein